MENLSSTFEHLHTELAECLVACRAHPGKHAVHSLRTTERQIEALLRKLLDDHPRAIRMQGKIEKALHQLRKIRRAAGPVRDLDVQRKLMAEIVGTYRTAESAEQWKEASSECKELDHNLHRQRKRFATKLTETLKDVEPKLERAVDRVCGAMENVRGISALKTARRMVLDNQIDLNCVSGEKLHRYRKQIKAARYLAEMQKTSPTAQRLAKRLRRVLDDIGRWHDLMLLCQESEDVLGKQSILTQAIKAELGRALDIATHSAGTIRPQR